MLFFHIHRERAYLSEESSTSTVIEHFDAAFGWIDADPVKVLPDKLYQEPSASDVVRHGGIVFGSPTPRV